MTVFMNGHRLRGSVRAIWHVLPPELRRVYWQIRGKFARYQNVVYRGRVLRGGADRREAYRLVFPSPPVGASVLDVGCNRGFYCFMAAGEGARYCLGIESDKRHFSKARSVLRQYSIPNVEFLHADAFELDFSSAFDTVLCLNVLQHVRTAERAKQLCAVLLRAARRRLVLIFPVPGTPEASYCNTIIEGTPYLLLSVAFVAECVHPLRLEHMLLPDHVYGPNRVLVSVNVDRSRSVSHLRATD